MHRMTALISLALSLSAAFLLLASVLPLEAALPLLGAGKGQDGYALLTLGGDTADRPLREALDAAGIPSISESGQWVYLDDFTGLRAVPLDEYPGTLEDFDPRNDGYGAALGSFFIREGKRRIYIPLEPEPAGLNAGNLEARLETLGLPPYSLDFLVSRQPFPLARLLLLFALAAAGAVVLSAAPLETAFLTPPLAALALAGSGGLALGALLTAALGCLGAPLQELFTARKGRFRTSLGVYRLPLILALVFLAFYGLMAAGGALFTALPVLGVCLGLLILIRWGEARRRRFTPLPIRRPRPVRFPRAMLPFALAAGAALLLQQLTGGLVQAADTTARAEAAFLPGEADYEAHIRFQAGFSYRPLGTSPEDALPYLSYVLGDDGLIGGTVEMAGSIPGEAELPRFPLEGLGDFLHNYQADTRPDTSRRDSIAVLLALGLSIPALVQSVLRDKRSA